MVPPDGKDGAREGGRDLQKKRARGRILLLIASAIYREKEREGERGSRIQPTRAAAGPVWSAS